jgi:hypothetical protein
MRIIATSCLIFLFGVSAWAQRLVSAKAGTVNYSEGIVYLNEAPLEFIADRLQVVEKGESLRTDKGRAEVQLGAYASLWLDNNAKLRMEDSSLTNILLQVEYGSVMVEIIEKSKNNRITMRFGDSVFTFEEIGVYRFDSKNPQLSVYEGRADIFGEKKKAKVKQGRKADLLHNLKLSKFDIRQRDQFRTWSDYRSGVLYGSIKAIRARQQMLQALENQRRQAQLTEAVVEKARYDEMMQRADQASQQIQQQQQQIQQQQQQIQQQQQQIQQQQQQIPTRSNDTTPPAVSPGTK